jgi:prolyl-tRNA synthetase
MKDLYSFHLDEKDLGEYYEKAKVAYWKILERVGLKEKTYLTFASGGTFSKYSHEFQTLAGAGEDTIYICQKCQNAINKEIKPETPVCPVCGAKNFKEEKAIEVGNIFKLKDKFTKPFNLKVADENGKSRILLMGCYGIGLPRLMGTIVEIHNDKNGIVWPESVAPFKIHLLEVGSEKSEVRKEAERLYKELKAKNIEVLYDDREDASAGEKFADADLIGIPIRVVVSEKSLKVEGVEVKKRSEMKTKIVSASELSSRLK